MATTAVEAAPRTAKPVARAMSWGEDLATVLFGLWLMAGIAVDGWAHRNLARIETFFTPWHAVFYSGFAATAGWVLWSVRRRRQAGRPLAEAIPGGYALGILGLVLFALGGVGDMVWHTFLGIEVNIDALMSPTHLILFIGVILIVTSPLRAAWQGEGRAPGLGAFLPVVLSASLATGFTNFMFLYLSPFMDVDMSRNANFFGENALGPGYESFLVQRSGIAAILVATVILFGAALLLLRRWRTPMFTFTVMFAVVGVLVQAVANFENAVLIGVAVIGGLIADLLVRFLDPSVERVRQFRTFAVTAPMALWALYVAAAAWRYGLGWEPELWTGVVIWSGLAGLGLSLFLLPPAVPATGGSSR